MVERKRISFSVGPYFTLLSSRKENVKFSEVALVAALQFWLCYDRTRILVLKHCQYYNGYLIICQKRQLKAWKKEVCSSLLTSVLEQFTLVLLVSFLLTLNTFPILSQWYYCNFEQVNVE